MKKMLILILCLTSFACSNISYGCFEVKSIESEMSRDGKYKYKVKFRAFIADHTLFTNDEYKVGQTIGNCEK